jgi:hypothetical protein
MRKSYWRPTGGRGGPSASCSGSGAQKRRAGRSGRSPGRGERGVERSHRSVVATSLQRIRRPQSGPQVLVKVEAAPVTPDAQLRSMALAHSLDMVQNLRVSRLSECLAFGFTPEDAYRNLMGSPAHRAAALSPQFTHVGIGATRQPRSASRPQLVATLLLARKPTRELPITLRDGPHESRASHHWSQGRFFWPRSATCLVAS